MARRDARALRDEVASAIDKGKFKRALECIRELEEIEPRDAAWPKRAAEVYRRLGKNREAIAAYERAADRYAQGGFLVQAIAVCKQILQLDPSHVDTLRRLSAITEQRQTGPTGVAAMHVASDAIPELVVTRNTGPMQRVDPATLLPPDREVERLDVEADKRGRPSATIPTFTPRPVSEDEFSLPDETPMPRPPPPRPPPPPVRTGPPPIPPSPRVRRASPPPLSGRRTRPSTSPVELQPGEPLDRVPLSTVMPGAEAQRRDDGLASGIVVIPLDDMDDVTGPLDIETLPQDDSPDVEVPLDAVQSWDGDTGLRDREPEEISIEEMAALAQPGTDEEEFAAPRMLSATARRALRSTPLLSGLDGEQLEALVEKIELVTLDPGEVLFREGDTGDSLFIISEGEVAVVSEGPPRAELSRLLPGSFFGEVALITETPRSATIAAVTRTELLAIDRDVVRALVAEHPDTLRVILRFIRNRLVEKVIQTSPLFVPFAEPDRRTLAERFDFLEVEPNTHLITQDTRPDGLYLILAGKAEAQRDLGEAVRSLGFLGPGEVFGEMALWGSEPSLATIIARGKVLALRMPAATFREVIMTHPQVLAYVGELAEARRRLIEAPNDSGDVVDLKLDLI
jgi:cAMP-dependent protein kinase regulator